MLGQTGHKGSYSLLNSREQVSFYHRAAFCVGTLLLLLLAIWSCGHGQKSIPVSKSARSLTAEDVSSPMPRIHISALTYQGMKSNDVWNAWYIQGRIELSESGLEPLTPEEIEGLSNCTAPMSKFLTFHMTYTYDSDAANIRRYAPCWMVVNLTQLSPLAQWGTSEPIFNNLRASRELYPDQNYYIYVSDSSVPVTSLMNILQEVVADKRTRFRIWYTGLRACAPHHLAFFASSPQHVDYLVEHPDTWSVYPGGRVRSYGSGGWVRGDGNMHGEAVGFKVAGADEFWPGWALLEASNFTQVHEHDKFLACASQSIFPETMRWEIGELLDFRFYHWTEWWDLPYLWRPLVMGAAQGGRNAHPLTFRTIQFGLLQYLSQQKGVWFARKFEADTIVNNCRLNATGEMELYTGWTHIFDDREVTEIYKDLPNHFYNPIEILDMMKTEKYDKAPCSLVEALQFLWRENSS